MRLASRIAALLALLAVPLLLAVASQSLAARPAAPPVPGEPVRLGERATEPGVTTPDDRPAGAVSAPPTAPSTAPPATSPTPPPSDRATGAPTAPRPAGPVPPRVVAPAPDQPELDEDDAEEQDEEQDEDD